MINNDSIVTAYDEHLTLVEWLQKIEKLLANGGLKSTALNDKGNATFSLTLTFNDNTTITSPDMTLTSVNEALTALNSAVAKIENGSTPLFETITDSHGNKRFVEGNVTITSNYDITPIYAKWTLSGSHLMIVICGSFTEGTAIDINKAFARINSLPSYIFDKIIPIISTRSFVSTINAQYLYITGSTILTLPCTLIKQANNLDVYFGDSLIATNDGALRAQFDFIIDNE